MNPKSLFSIALFQTSALLIFKAVKIILSYPKLKLSPVFRTVAAAGKHLYFKSPAPSPSASSNPATRESSCSYSTTERLAAPLASSRTKASSKETKLPLSPSTSSSWPLSATSSTSSLTSLQSSYFVLPTNTLTCLREKNGSLTCRGCGSDTHARNLHRPWSGKKGKFESVRIH